jgi:hypothetical protein
MSFQDFNKHFISLLIKNLELHMHGNKKVKIGKLKNQKFNNYKIKLMMKFNRMKIKNNKNNHIQEKKLNPID